MGGKRKRFSAKLIMTFTGNFQVWAISQEKASKFIKKRFEKEGFERYGISLRRCEKNIEIVEIVEIQEIESQSDEA